VIVLGSLGAAAQFGGVVLVVKEIAGDRAKARELVDKQRDWKPRTPRPPRRVFAAEVEIKNTPFHPAENQQIAEKFASIITAHNQVVHDVDQGFEQRTALLLEQIDEGDRQLRDVLRYLLRGSVIERIGGVLAILAGILLSLAATIVGAG
jgi:hypothetical protein